MLTNVNSKVKYPSFRIDDILNDNFGSRSPPSERRASNDEDVRDRTFESNNQLTANLCLKAASEDESDDQPINLSSVEYPKRHSDTLLSLRQFSLQMNENFSESTFQNLKSISSISSSSPTLSVGSSDSPSFPNQLSPTSKSPPTIDQLIKCNLNHSAFNENDGSNHLKSHFPTNLLNLSLSSDETDHSQPTISEHSNLPGAFLNGQQYPRSAIEEFYLKLNKKQLENRETKFEPTTFESTNFESTFDKPADSLSEEASLHSITDALKKFQQDYQTQQLAKSSLLNQLPTYPATMSSNYSPISPQLNHPSSSLYMQQFYIRMKMAMQSKPRKGGQIRFNHQQTNELEAMFSMKTYLLPSERRQIAKKLSLSERQVKTWFQNRRAKQRRSKSF